MSKNMLNRLPKGKYLANIQSEFKNGHMNGAHALLKGKVKKIISTKIGIRKFIEWYKKYYSVN